MLTSNDKTLRDKEKTDELLHYTFGMEKLRNCYLLFICAQAIVQT